MNSAPMIDLCFRHQHPEAYGEAEVSEPPIPAILRYGSDPLPSPSLIIFPRSPWVSASASGPCHEGPAVPALLGATSAG